MVSNTPWPHFIPEKDPVPILREVGWVPGSVWTGGKSRPYRDSIPDRPARNQSLYQLSYPAHPDPGTSQNFPGGTEENHGKSSADRKTIIEVLVTEEGPNCWTDFQNRARCRLLS